VVDSTSTREIALTLRNLSTETRETVNSEHVSIFVPGYRASVDLAGADRRWKGDSRVDMRQ